MLESMRRRLRSLIKLIERSRRNVVYTDYQDQVGNLVETKLRGIALGTNRSRFEAKVRTHLRSHENEISVQKLRRNRQLTIID
jgi:type I restriction enzyme R subunit